ncbi:PD40 domain-containing protein [bacterium]|nr:PD40 domain-containing protein [bacterium]
MRVKHLLIFLLLISSISIFGFGQNKLYYKNFKWFIKESKHFKIFYYKAEENRLLEIINILENAYSHHSNTLKFEIKDKTTVIIYKTHRDFEQTNIISGFVPPQVGGFAETLMKRLVVPVDSPHEELRSLIWHELTHIFQYHILKNRVLKKEPPMWFMEGTAEFFSQHWDMTGKMMLRDAVMNNNFYSLQQMENFYYTPNVFQCYKESQSFIEWFYNKYGIENFRKLFRYMRKIGKMSLDEIFKKVTGYSYKRNNDMWYNYLKKQNWPKIKNEEDPDVDYGECILNELYSRDIWLQPVFYPSGAMVAAITNKNGKLDIYSVRSDGKKLIKRITPLATGKYEYLIVENNSMSISPDGKKLAIFARDGRADVLMVFDLMDYNFKKYRLNDMLKPRFPMWKDGDSLFFTAESKGGREIFLFSLRSRETEQITKETGFIQYIAYDKNKNGIYFTKSLDKYKNIFYLDLKNKVEKQITFSKSWDIQLSISADGQRLLFVSDRANKIPNLFLMEMKTGEIKQLTNVTVGNIMPNISPDGKTIAFTSYKQGSYKTYIRKVSDFKVFKTYHDDPANIYAQAKLNYNVDFLKNVKQYKLKFLPVNAGSYVTYENGIIENYSNITLTDTLGDHVISLTIDAIRQFNNFYMYYFDQSHRLNWGFVGYNRRQEYYFWDLNATGYEGNWGGSLMAIYAFSKYNRLEMELKYGFKYYNSIFQDYYNYPSVKRVAGATFNYVHDNTKPGFFTYNQGSRYMLSFTGSAPVTDNYYESYNFLLDYRKYMKITMRSTLAFRLFGYTSWGQDPNYIYLGGTGSVRGYYPMSIYGNNGFFSNVELRIPFIDILRLSGIFNFYYIRGLFFLDVGDAWIDNDFHGFNRTKNGYVFDDIKSSVGFGIRFSLGYFDLMFDFAKRWDFQRIDPHTYFQFDISTDF